MFSKEELMADGLTEEESDLLLDALALKDTVNMLPDNIESLVKEYEEKVPADETQGMRKMFELAKKEPELFRQIMALEMVLSQGDDQPEIKGDKTFVTELPDKEYETFTNNFAKKLAGLSGDERKEFLKLIVNLTTEQKQDIVSRLSKD